MRLTVILSLILSTFSSPLTAQAPKVLVTIKPLHALTQAIMEGVGSPELLLKGTADPHHFSLSPSHMKSINTADLVIWIGPALEHFMIKPLSTTNANHVALMLTKNLTLLKNSGDQRTIFKPDRHTLPQEYIAIDPHLWLDIDNALKIVTEITYHLSALDIENAALYQRNREALMKKIKGLKKELAEQAPPLKGVRFIAFHDAFGYLERRYGLINAAAPFLKGHGTPSLKALSDIRRLIKTHKIKPLLTDPQHKSELEDKLAKDFNMSLVSADPLGSEIESGPEHFFILMGSLFTHFKKTGDQAPLEKKVGAPHAPHK